MKLNELKNNEGAKKSNFRAGRGIGSGNGKTSGRGHKGQKSRSGYSRKVGFEGGQMPLQRRLPKRGFNNKDFKIFYSIVNLDDLNRLKDGAVVTPDLLVSEGIVKSYSGRLKVLGDGDLTLSNIEIHAHKFSKTALEKIKDKKIKFKVID